MYDLSPFSDANLARLHAARFEPRDAASLFHATRVHLAGEEALFPREDAAHPGVLIVQAAPNRPMTVSEELYEDPEGLRELVADTMANVPGVRWSQDGLTVLDSRTDVRLAVTFTPRGYVELFSKHPLSVEEGQPVLDVPMLEGLVMSLTQIAHGWHAEAGRQVGFWLDLSLSEVSGYRAVRSSEGGGEDTGELDRDHVHLRYEITAVAEDALEGTLRPFLHRIRQASGVA